MNTKTQKVDVLAVMDIQFAPCTGFGDAGRSATLIGEHGEVVGTGYGATNDEAVVEALIDGGLFFDEAFDACAGVMARCIEPDDEYVEFPGGEFPPQANVGALS